MYEFALEPRVGHMRSQLRPVVIHLIERKRARTVIKSDAQRIRLAALRAEFLEDPMLTRNTRLRERKSRVVRKNIRHCVPLQQVSAKTDHPAGDSSILDHTSRVRARDARLVDLSFLRNRPCRIALKPRHVAKIDFEDTEIVPVRSLRTPT